MQAAIGTEFPSAKYWSIFKEGGSEANMLYTELMPNGSRVKFKQNVLTERFEYLKLFFFLFYLPHWQVFGIRSYFRRRHKAGETVAG